MRFRDPELPLKQRIDDLLSRLTLEEKCSLLRYDAPAIERLDIPSYNWWNEALHGVGRAGKATVFPQAIGMAACWDPGFIESVASAISDEARAKHHEAKRKGSHQQYQGLTFWSPNINIFRDPRWGRGQETWGEDPFLTGELGAAFVRGLQGEDEKHLKTAACAKHYAVHSGPEPLRHQFDACPSLKDFEETYLPAFKRLVDEKVECVMGAYNAVYGEPCNGSKLLLEDILRKRWGFEGHVVSDCWAIRDFHEHYKVTSSIEESAAMALKAGCDLNCGSVFCDALLDAVNLGLCSVEDVERALRRLLSTQFRLGMFDPEETVPYASIPYDVVCCEKHQQLALEAAERSIVLLKNKNNALPLDGDTKAAFLVGPYAANVEVLLGNYFGFSPKMSTLLEGVTQYAPPELKLDFRKGCLSDRPNYNSRDWSTFEVSNVDAVIAAVGLNPNIEGEEGDAIQSSSGGDRIEIGLPENQKSYLLTLAEAIRKRKESTRLIVVVFGGSHIAMPEVQDVADAILHAWYPGEAGGEAIARILFGKCSPEAKMPITVPVSLDVVPPFEDYSMSGRTYRFMRPDNILYPFGYGLSYTRFEYGKISLDRDELRHGETLAVKVDVTNCGDFDGGEIVQCYARMQDNEGEGGSPKLVAFNRVFLRTGETKTVALQLNTSRLLHYNDDGSSIPFTGKLNLFVGGRAPIDVSPTEGLPGPQSVGLVVLD
ncbi:MAG: glycoside hydrolase family 3 N-terminal domain-containing protein [Puniceicoccaceae bacterium]